MQKISVIIPSRNRAEQVLYCISALTQQTLSPRNFEIIIVDDGSTDNTEKNIKKLQKENPSHNIRLVSIKRKDKKFRAAVARNVGAKRAKGDVLLFIDSDIISEPHMLENHLKHFKKANRKVTVMGYRFSILEQFHLIIFDLIKKRQLDKIKDIPLLFDIREPEESKFRLSVAKLGEEHIPWRHYHSHNISMTKKVFHKVGGFDETFVGWGDEDIELGYRLWKHGCDFYFDREVIGFHLDHPVNQKSAIISQFSNKRRVIGKHQSLELELFNDDTNAFFWTENEMHHFRYLQQEEKFSGQKINAPQFIPKNVFNKAECIIGEGPELKKFKNLKYFLNIRNGMSKYIPKKVKHFRIIGSLNPLGDNSVKTTLIYNYLENFPSFYVIKILSEALRTSKEVYVIHKDIENYAMYIESFASSEIEVERIGGILSKEKVYYKLSKNKKAKRAFPSINLLLSSFNELNENPDILKLTKYLDRTGFNISINVVNFDYRYGLENSSSLFKMHAGFIYENWWKYFTVNDEEAINIHTNIDYRWRPGANLVILKQSTFIGGDIKRTEKELRRYCDYIFSLGRTPYKVKLAPPHIKFFQKKYLGREIWDGPIKLVYPIKSLDNDEIKNLHSWLEAFIKIKKSHPLISFNVIQTFEKTLQMPYLGVTFRSLKGGKIWNNFYKKVEIYNKNKKIKAEKIEQILNFIIKVYKRALKEENKDVVERSSLKALSQIKVLSPSIRYIEYRSGPNFIRNRRKIAASEAFGLLQKAVTDANKMNLANSFITNLETINKNLKKDKILMRSLWIHLKAKDWKNFNKALKKAKMNKTSVETKFAEAVSLFYLKDLKRSKELFLQIIKVKDIEKSFLAADIFNWLGRLFFALNENKNAMESFRKSLQINPINVTALAYKNYLKNRIEAR